jgi:hypothetical protein
LQLTRRGVRTAGVLLLAVGTAVAIAGVALLVVRGYAADADPGRDLVIVGPWVTLGAGMAGLVLGATLAMCADFVERER